MDNKLIWKVERQPVWPVAAIKRTITDLPSGYTETVEWLGVTENTLFNRPCVDGDQIFSLGRAMALQRASDLAHIADTVAHHSQDVFVPLADVDDLDSADTNQCLMESIERIGHYSDFVRKATAGGVIDADEYVQIEENSYQVTAKFQERVAPLYRVSCVTEKSDTRGCAAPGALASNSSSMEKQSAWAV